MQSFETAGTNVVTGVLDTNLSNDVFVRDRLMSTTESISVTSTGANSGGQAYGSAISPDGRYVAFLSSSNNLVPMGPDTFQVYRRDRDDGSVAMMSVDNAGVAAAPYAYNTQVGGYLVSVALDGAVVFHSFAENLVATDNNGQTDVFMRRLEPGSAAGTTPLANVGGPYLGWASSDGVPAGIRLDASASKDPKDRPLTAHWDFGDGSAVEDGALDVTHAYAEPGVYQVTLTVSAEGDVSEPITTEVEIMPALAPPAISAGACAPPSGTLTLTGASVAANAALVAEGWDRSAGKLPLGPATVTLPWGDVQVSLDLPGLTFRKDATVPAGLESGKYVAVLEGAEDAPFAVPCGKPDNERPVAHAGGPIYTTQAGVPVTLDGGASSDAEGSQLTYTWDFGDGETGTGAAPEHTYASPGRYMLTLIVNDGTGDSADWVGTRSFAMVEVTEPTDGPGPAGAVPGAGAGDGGGCGCTTSRSATPLGLGIGMALLLLARRRRRRIALP